MVIGNMMMASTMVTPRIKKLAAAHAEFAQLERTVATELPQELSALPEHYVFSDVNSVLEDDESVAQGGCRKKAGRPKKVAGTKPREYADITATGFMDDGHPTILADTHDGFQVR